MFIFTQVTSDNTKKVTFNHLKKLQYYVLILSQIVNSVPTGPANFWSSVVEQTDFNTLVFNLI